MNSNAFCSAESLLGYCSNHACDFNVTRCLTERELRIVHWSQTSLAAPQAMQLSQHLGIGERWCTIAVKIGGRCSGGRSPQELDCGKRWIVVRAGSQRGESCTQTDENPLERMKITSMDEKALKIDENSNGLLQWKASCRAKTATGEYHRRDPPDLWINNKKLKKIFKISPKITTNFTFLIFLLYLFSLADFIDLRTNFLPHQLMRVVVFDVERGVWSIERQLSGFNMNGFRTEIRRENDSQRRCLSVILILIRVRTQRERNIERSYTAEQQTKLAPTNFLPLENSMNFIQSNELFARRLQRLLTSLSCEICLSSLAHGWSSEHTGDHWPLRPTRRQSNKIQIGQSAGV